MKFLTQLIALIGLAVCLFSITAQAGDPILRKPIITGTERIFVYVDYISQTQNRTDLATRISKANTTEILVKTLRYRFSTKKDNPCYYYCKDQSVYVLESALEENNFVNGKKTGVSDENAVQEQGSLVVFLYMYISDEVLVMDINFDRPGKKLATPTFPNPMAVSTDHISSEKLEERVREYIESNIVHFQTNYREEKMTTYSDINLIITNGMGALGTSSVWCLSCLRLIKKFSKCSSLTSSKLMEMTHMLLRIRQPMSQALTVSSSGLMCRIITASVRNRMRSLRLLRRFNDGAERF